MPLYRWMVSNICTYPYLSYHPPQPYHYVTGLWIRHSIQNDHNQYQLIIFRLGHLPLFLLKDFEKHKPPFCWPPATTSQPPNHRPGSLVVAVHNSAVTPASRPHAAARRDAIYPGADWKGESKPMATELPGKKRPLLANKKGSGTGKPDQKSMTVIPTCILYIIICYVFSLFRKA